MYEYKFLTEDEMDDIVVATHAGHEVDKFSHELALARYNDILSKLSDEEVEEETNEAYRKELIIRGNPKSKERYTWTQFLIINRRNTISRINEVNGLLIANEKHLPKGDRLQKAKERRNSAS